MQIWSARRRARYYFRFCECWFRELLPLFPFSLLFDYRLRCGQPGDGHAERGCAHIVHLDLMAELDAFRVAAVLAADADLQFRPSAPAPRNAHTHQFPDSLDVQSLEGVGGKYPGLFFVDVVWQEAAGVVAREAHGRLRQIVGAEGEELGYFGDLRGEQGCSG